jgi:hypothetical protein
MRMIIVVSLLVVGATAWANRDRDMVEQAWKSVKHDQRMWQWALTPPLPGSWPPTTTLTRYAYAFSFDPALADGQRVAGPWARIVLPPEGAPRLEALRPDLHELGIQGVHPVAPSERPSADELQAADLQMKAIDPKAAPPRELKRVVCYWRSNNGVIAAALADQQAFFSWLRC